MSEFTIRVELHLADSRDYEKLHDAMAVYEYSRIITDEDGISYYLPTAEYTTTKSTTSAGIRAQVERIASSVKANPRILVTKVAERSWQLVRVQ